MDWEVFWRTRSPSLKEWVRSLNKQAGLPHRATCIKIIHVIRLLVQQKLHRIIKAHAAHRMAPHSGTQCDIWSEKSARNSFFCMRQSMILEPELVYEAGSIELGKHNGHLLDVAPMLDFTVFTNTAHSAKNVASMKKKVLAKYDETPKDISLATEDGASNNKKAAKILDQPFFVCFPHQLQRAILYSTGMTGSNNLNPDLDRAISAMSSMAAAPHRSPKVAGKLSQLQIASGTSKSHVLTTSTKNQTRWQGLFAMANKNRRLKTKLEIALTGKEGGYVSDNDKDDEQEEEEEEQQAVLHASDQERMYESNNEDSDVFVDVDSDEELVQSNEASNKNFPLAHRLLTEEGFKHNNILESVLSCANEVCSLVQKQEGMGLSMGFKFAKVCKDDATHTKVNVVSGTSKDGDWKQIAASTLPDMFKLQRRIFAEQLELRFKVDGTPDSYTLLALKMDPSVNTTEADGIFKTRKASQQLMDGVYRRRLVRRQKMLTAGNPSSVPAKRVAPSKDSDDPPKRSKPVGVLSRVSQCYGQSSSEQQGQKSASMDVTDNSLEFVKLEEAKYASICANVFHHPDQYMVDGMFDLAQFWAEQKFVLPIHYSLWLAEVGCAKVASSNVETVFSGAGRISAKSHKLDTGLLSDYAFLHYNYKYDWLRPTVQEIVEAYNKIYGKELHESDYTSSGSEGEEEDATDEPEEGGAGGGED